MQNNNQINKHYEILFDKSSETAVDNSLAYLTDKKEL